MKKYLLLILLLNILPQSLHAADWYVRPSASGTANGSNWNNSWSLSGINWGSVQPGDTIWLAGGSYTSGLQIGKSGNASNRIYIKRALSSDSVPASAAGWSSTFDTTVRLNSISSSEGKGYITIDGRTEGQADGQTGANDYGIAMVLGNGADGIRMPGSDSISLSYIQMIGPGWGDYCGYGIFINGAGGTGNANHYIGHVYMDGVIQQITVGEWKSGVIEYCKLYNAGTGSAAGCHSDSIYFSSPKNVHVRYSRVYNSWSQSLFFDNGGDSGIYFYGNIFDQGPKGSGTAIQTKQGYAHGDFHIYNNTFIGWGISSIQFRGTHSGTSEVKNNIFWNTSWGVAGDGTATVQADYNLFSGSKASGDGSNSIGNASNPFGASSDSHLAAGSSAVNKGTALTVNGLINKDLDGNTRGADGKWDIGAYEYNAGGPGALLPAAPANFRITGV